MEDEKVLKQKYNDLLKSYTTGAEYLVEHPEEKEKVEKRLEELSKEIENIMKMFPDMTEQEKNEGFVIDEVEVVEEPKQTENKPIVVESKQTALQSFSDDWKIANQLAKSTIIPKEYQGKPENVVLCMGMSRKIGLDVMTVINNLQLVMGKQEWKGSFIPVLIEMTEKYTDLEHNFVGKESEDNFGCYLEATRVRDGKRIKGTTVTISMAKKEGWYNRNSKWQTMPQQMLIYRASAFFARAYCPAALNGLFTEGESSDIQNNRNEPQDIL